MKTMPEYIEREALITLINDKQTEGYELCMPAELKAHYVAGLHKAKQFVEKAPTADVVEVKHSAWGHKYSLHKIVCLNCGTPRPYQKTKRGYHLAWDSPYCPNCGAKMDLKEGAENG